MGLILTCKNIDVQNQGLDKYGFGMSSVRFILEHKIFIKNLKIMLKFLSKDSILYAAAFDANGGVFEPLLSAEDAINFDELNHASIIGEFVYVKHKDTDIKILTCKT